MPMANVFVRVLLVDILRIIGRFFGRRKELCVLIVVFLRCNGGSLAAGQRDTWLL